MCFRVMVRVETKVYRDFILQIRTDFGFKIYGVRYLFEDLSIKKMCKYKKTSLTFREEKESPKFYFSRSIPFTEELFN